LILRHITRYFIWIDDDGGSGTAQMISVNQSEKNWSAASISNRQRKIS